MAALRVDQLRELEEIFARFDMDSEGSLTELELPALLRSLGVKLSGDQIRVLLASMDSNGNGAVEFDELVSAILPTFKREITVNEGELMEVFRLFDRDGKGFITAVELAGCMDKMGHPLTHKELREMMRQADSDGDGVISFSEFSSIMAKLAMDFLGVSFSTY
ncbi:probable calcium-binding protein CML15 [Hibiscus syriacus]|uniref:probable calcium-binding protein CML15 n=1 Tax=Hibiscus syriacus TaxID=106335 RepID=UPI0019213536|nr:probable calcium-binding protein CML15 [Hibiscus syriacus]